MELRDLSDLFARLVAALAWLPDGAVGLVLLAIAAVLALAVHQAVIVALDRAIFPRRVFLRSLIAQTRGLTRAAAVIFAWSAVLPSAPFAPGVAAAIAHGLLVALIALLGWAALIASRIGAELYLMRFRLDVEDNLLARKHVTQVRILHRAADTLVIIVTLAVLLMSFDTVRQYGVSLFASAGVVGLAVGLAARPLLSNLIAGVQIAMTQPIRIEDAVLLENEFGFVEEIAATYVVIRLWDLRRLIVPLNYFMEKPFQNWTRQSGRLIGSVTLHVDYGAPVECIRAKLTEIVKDSPLWDADVVALQVTDATPSTMELRALVSGRTAATVFDLRCLVREKLIAFLQAEHPQALPGRRAALDRKESVAAIDGGEAHPAPVTEASTHEQSHRG
jgi:small-conductance mechanosensitive channel